MHNFHTTNCPLRKARPGNNKNNNSKTSTYIIHTYNELCVWNENKNKITKFSRTTFAPHLSLILNIFRTFSQFAAFAFRAAFVFPHSLFTFSRGGGNREKNWLTGSRGLMCCCGLSWDIYSARDHRKLFGLVIACTSRGAKNSNRNFTCKFRQVSPSLPPLLSHSLSRLMSLFPTLSRVVDCFAFWPSLGRRRRHQLTPA